MYTAVPGLFTFCPRVPGALPIRSGRAIAARRKGRRPGRPQGCRTALHTGERSAVELIRHAIDKLGEDDPLLQELLQLELRIARGEPGYRGRYIGQRLRAAMDLLDRHIGNPTQPIEHRGKLTLEQLVQKSLSRSTDDDEDRDR